MLETLLNHFRSYGLNDLEFIIVNSKLSHAQERLHELKNRVSFDVFQETEEEEVWSLMEGGKDDMYVYDRCGRLTFYIPFPLSILNETPLVANAILTTYFRSPCGDNCIQNRTMDLDEFVKNLEKNLETSNETEQINDTQVETELSSFTNETYNETSSSNDLLSVIDPVEEEIDTFNTSLTSNMTDYDYPDYSISNVNNTNSTNVEEVEEAKSYFNSIYKLFFNNDKDTEEKQESNLTLRSDSNATILYESLPDENYTQEHKKHNHTEHHHKSNNHHHNHHPHHHHHHHDKNEHKHDSKDKKKSDRCLEADYQVCRSWTKKRLLHAQKCCSGKTIETDISDPKSCYNFGKKRCKKIQSILKCCIKTVYIDTSTNVYSSETTPTAVKSENEMRSLPKTAAQNSEIICCKIVDNDKQCRVANSEYCEEGEFMQPPSECKNPPCQIDQPVEAEKQQNAETP